MTSATTMPGLRVENSTSSGWLPFPSPMEVALTTMSVPSGTW